MNPSHLRNELETSLLVHDRNVNRWRRNNFPEVRFIHKIERIVYYTFEPLMNKWKHVPEIVKIIDKCVRVLCIVMKTGVNVPFPEMYSRHMHAIFDNVIEVYMLVFHVPLKKAIHLAYINESLH